MLIRRSGCRAVVAVALFALTLTACAPNQTTTATSGWRPLFNGTSLQGWRSFKTQTPPAGWSIVDGMLVRTGRGGDIMTVDQFGDFELELDWKVQPGGNSGVIYRIVEEGNATYMSGLEMQVLDDSKHRDGGNPLTSAGALYGLYPAPRGIVKPAGEWNAARLVVKGQRVEHWLNGTKVVDAELWSPDFSERHAKSKFKEWPMFAKATRGHLALQDHGDTVYYRNVRIREP